MGGMASNPFDAEAQKELDGIIKETIAEFGKQYTFALAVNLVKQAQEEMDKKDEKKEEAPQRQLVSDNDPPKEVHKEGYLVKQGIIRKNWLQRYFTINPDYSISYKVKKEDAKEKGKFTLGGYTVLDFDSKDKPFTIHCKHWDKRNWYFQVPKPENKDVSHEDEYKKWKDAFTNAARKAPNPMDPDPLLRRTYQRAYLKTYEKWWGWSSYFYCTGSESEMIGDLIMRRLRWGLLWRVYGKLKGPASIQNKMRDTIGKQVKIAVQAACVAGFKAMAEARDKVKPEMEKQIKENGAPIFEGISKMKSSVQDKLMDVLNPIIEKTANPLVEKVLSKAFTPIANAHVEALKGFKRCCEWYRGGDGKDGWNESTIRRMNWWVWWYLWESRAIMYQMSSDDVVRKALTPPSSGETSGPNDAGEKDDEASNSGLANKINDQLADQCLAAVFTLGKDKDLNVVVGKFVNDSKILLREQYKSFLLGVIQPNLMALASKTILELVKPLDDALPDLLKNFISGHDMCVEIIKNVSDQIAEKFVETAYAPEAERMEKALKEVFPAEAPKS